MGKKIVKTLNMFTDVNGSTTSAADVSILVTEPSPEVPVGPKINPNQTLIHHVIVHRESEEYQTDLDDPEGARRSSNELKFSDEKS